MIAAVLDHLWQCTIFAGVAGLLTLVLRDNAARVRFWVWFAASAKFLVPFELLAALSLKMIPQPAAPLLLLDAWGPAAEPFVVPAANSLPSLIAVSGFDWTGPLLMVWGLGTLAIAVYWLSRWLKLRTALAGPGTVILIGDLAVRRAHSLMGPGLFGVWRPVILLPQDIETRLSPAELKAVLAHEACHIKYRDNLLAAFHMLVSAVFWFHPLVWWLGARLNQERERACDEAVLAAGQEPNIYAESILKVCKLYVQSPLACVSGISGAGLKQRIERIVMCGAALPLGGMHKLLLGGLAAASLVVPLSAGLAMAPLAVETQKLERSRRTVAFEPRHFDRFIGKYQFGPGILMTVMRDGNHYLTRLTGQGNVEYFPESQTSFFATLVAAQIRFDSDAGGRVTELVLRQNGREHHAPRITAQAAKAIEDETAARIKSNRPSPGTEASLRRYIASLEKGAPNYDEMGPSLAAVVRDQLPRLLKFIRRSGPLKTLNFRFIDATGMDVYEAEFERSRAFWHVAPLTEDGKVYHQRFRPVI